VNGAGTHSPNRFPLRLPADGFRTALHFALIFGVLAGGIIAAGYGYWRNQERHYRAKTEQALAVVADLKVSELTQWRKDRRGDAALFFKNPSFSALVQRVFAQPPDADAQRQIHDWLVKYPTLDDYDQVRLMDTQAVTRLALPGGLKPASADTVRAAADALRSGQITLLDFYRHEHNARVYLSVQIPLFDPLDTNRPLGVLVLRIDPEKYLFPFITRWPTPNPTAETMLVRRDGDDVLCLNDIRNQTNTALTLRLPLTRTDIPAVRAALGQTGFMEGPDYRGVPVIAIARGVPDSPWIIIAKTDAADADVPPERLWQDVVMIAGLLFGTGASAWLIWRRKSVRHYREQARAADLIRSKSEELKRFTYTVSHDLRSPVVTIQTFLGHLELDIPARNAARVADDLTFIHTAVDQMARLLDELLKLSRLGHQTNPPEKVLLQAVVKEALDLVAGQIEQRGALVSAATNPVTLHGDRTRFVALFQNLVDNACKFMGEQTEPRIEIGVETRDAETVFFVRDNGIGIDPRHHAKVFDLFEKLDPKTDGTGFGLALVKRIAEGYAGRIWVESKGAGQGTCFYFTLPEANPGREGPSEV
jgi:signal transduction histidine kinase